MARKQQGGIEEAGERKPALTPGRFVHADRYLVVLGLIAIVIIGNAFLAVGTAGLFFMLFMLAVTLVVTLVTSKAGWGTAALAGVVVALVIGAGVAAQALGQIGGARLDYQLAIIAMGLATAVVIGWRITKHPTVSVDTVAGAAAIYLLFGLVFAILFAFVGDILISFDPSVIARVGAHSTAAQAFFMSSRLPLPSDFLYYSFVTLTTVGYGDLTAATQFGRMLSVSEALVGQLYLVTVLAILVSNLRPRAQTADVAPEPQGVGAASGDAGEVAER